MKKVLLSSFVFLASAGYVVYQYLGGGSVSAAAPLTGAVAQTTQVSPGASQGGGIQVGQKVTLKNGTTITVKAVHPDGSFD